MCTSYAYVCVCTMSLFLRSWSMMKAAQRVAERQDVSACAGSPETETQGGGRRTTGPGFILFGGRAKTSGSASACPLVMSLVALGACCASWQTHLRSGVQYSVGALLAAGGQRSYCARDRSHRAKTDAAVPLVGIGCAQRGGTSGRPSGPPSETAGRYTVWMLLFHVLSRNVPPCPAKVILHLRLHSSLLPSTPADFQQE